jgi:hypothetical protein
MQLDTSYDFLELTQQEGVDVWKARDKATGKLVQIHLFPVARQSSVNAICAGLIGLPAEARGKILQFGPARDATCFVTDLLPEGESLQNWIARQGLPQPVAPVSRVRVGAVGNLRKLDIEPAALAPLPPGPDVPGQSAAKPAGPPPQAAAPLPRTPAPLPRAGKPSTQGQPQGGFTEFYSQEQIQASLEKESQPAPLSIPLAPAQASLRDTFDAYYGGGETRTFEPARPEAGAADLAPSSGRPAGSLDSFLGLLPPAAPPLGPAPDAREAAIRQPDSPPPPLPVSLPPRGPAQEPAGLYPILQAPEPPPERRGVYATPVQPTLFDLPSVPAPDPQPFLPPPEPPQMALPHLSERRVKPIPDSLAPLGPGTAPLPAPMVRPSAPAPSPRYAPAADTPRSPGIVDWRTVMWVVLILLAVFAAVVAIVENSG